MADTPDFATLISKRTELILKITELTSEYARLQTIVLGLDVGFQKLEDENVDDLSALEIDEGEKHRNEASIKMQEVETTIHDLEQQVVELDKLLKKMDET